MKAYVIGNRQADNDVWVEEFAERIGAEFVEENAVLENLRENGICQAWAEQIAYMLIGLCDCVICLDRYGDKKTKYKVEYAKAIGKKVHYRHYYGRRSK